MKWPLISKFKGPAQKGADPTEEELTARYLYFKRRNKIGNYLFFTSIIVMPVATMATPELADMFGARADNVVMGSWIAPLLLMWLGVAIINDKKEKLYKPLDCLSETDQGDALRLIQFVSEARKLNQRAREQGRSLRGFDLEAMRDFEKQRNAKRLLRHRNRLKIQAPGVSKPEIESSQGLFKEREKNSATRGL